MRITSSRRRRVDDSSGVTRPKHSLFERLESRTFLSATPAPTPAQQVAQANNAFAFDLMHELAPDGSGNLFFSPYSADTALEMALQGASGVTASEMIQALHLPGSAVAQAGIEALYQLFQATPATAGYTLSTANRLWVNANFPTLQSFIDSSENTFGAAPQTVDFSNPQAAANTINNWVSNQTDGKITNLIPASDLGPFTSLVLTNAIYFQANWAAPFNAGATQQKAFQIASTEAANVQMMEQTGEFGYYAQSGANGFQALGLPYQNGNLDMLVILPATYDVAGFASTLNATLFSQISASLATTSVDVSLPKFQLNETYDLVAPLEQLGINTAFSRAADFSGMNAQPTHISDVVQKSYVSVDETGTTAAAATGVVSVAGDVIGSSNPPVTFDANHPFIFAIRDAATNTILFLGSVSDPSSGGSDFKTAVTPLNDPIVSTSTIALHPILNVNNDPLPPIQTAVATWIAPLISATARTSFTATLATGDLPALPDGATAGVTISWAAGVHSVGTLTSTGQSFTITGGHTYHSHGKYHVTITVWQKSHGKEKILARLKTTAEVEPAAR